ncbi:MAG TPA: cytochrome c [Cytophagaceae bacterium]|jgi:mono/diheme cytochrome c family protein
MYGRILFILLLLFGSCATPRRSEPIKKAMALNTDKLVKGRHLFLTHCYKCHPNGEAGKGPSINNIPIPGIALRARIRSKAFFLGVGRMPSFKQNEISKDDMDLLVTYIKELKKNKASVD